MIKMYSIKKWSFLFIMLYSTCYFETVSHAFKLLNVEMRTIISNYQYESTNLSVLV